ncbi:hypothetical protein [Gimesia sp.]
MKKADELDFYNGTHRGMSVRAVPIDRPHKERVWNKRLSEIIFVFFLAR